MLFYFAISIFKCSELKNGSLHLVKRQVINFFLKLMMNVKSRKINICHPHTHEGQSDTNNRVKTPKCKSAEET